MTDAVLVLVLVATVISSVVNRLGPYDGMSQALVQALRFVLPVFLARVHLTGPKSFRTFLVCLVWASIIYLPFALYEFRMSPMIHTKLYGFFQHTWLQFRRGSFWRPVVCFTHALDLGRFFAFSAYLAAFPLRRELMRWGKWGKYLFLAPLLGLLISMSFSPYLLFILLVGSFFLAKKFHRSAYLLPAAAFVWIFLVFAGARPYYGAVDVVAEVSPQRAQSLEYRIDALEEYRDEVLAQPVWGYSGWARGREQGVATDSIFLVRSITFGLVGACLFFGWWGWGAHNGLELARGLRGTAFGTIALGTAVLAPVCIAISVIDAATDTHVLLIVAAFVGMEGQFRTECRRAARPAPGQPAPAQG